MTGILTAAGWRGLGPVEALLRGEGPVEAATSRGDGPVATVLGDDECGSRSPLPFPLLLLHGSVQPRRVSIRWYAHLPHADGCV